MPQALPEPAAGAASEATESVVLVLRGVFAGGDTSCQSRGALL